MPPQLKRLATEMDQHEAQQQHPTEGSNSNSSSSGATSTQQHALNGNLAVSGNNLKRTRTTASAATTTTTTTATKPTPLNTADRPLSPTSTTCLASPVASAALMASRAAGACGGVSNMFQTADPADMSFVSRAFTVQQYQPTFLSPPTSTAASTSAGAGAGESGGFRSMIGSIRPANTQRAKTILGLPQPKSPSAPTAPASALASTAVIAPTAAASVCMASPAKPGSPSIFAVASSVPPALSSRLYGDGHPPSCDVNISASNNGQQQFGQFGFGQPPQQFLQAGSSVPRIPEQMAPDAAAAAAALRMPQQSHLLLSPSTATAAEAASTVVDLTDSPDDTPSLGPPKTLQHESSLYNNSGNSNNNNEQKPIIIDEKTPPVQLQQAAQQTTQKQPPTPVSDGRLRCIGCLQVPVTVRDPVSLLNHVMSSRKRVLRIGNAQSEFVDVKLVRETGNPKNPVALYISPPNDARTRLAYVGPERAQMLSPMIIEGLVLIAPMVQIPNSKSDRLLSLVTILYSDESRKERALENMSRFGEYPIRFDYWADRTVKPVKSENLVIMGNNVPPPRKLPSIIPKKEPGDHKPAIGTSAAPISFDSDNEEEEAPAVVTKHEPNNGYGYLSSHPHPPPPSPLINNANITNSNGLVRLHKPTSHQLHNYYSHSSAANVNSNINQSPPRQHLRPAGESPHRVNTNNGPADLDPNDDVATQVDKLTADFSAHLTMPEAKQPEALKSTMHAHQRQALYFMLWRESHYGMIDMRCMPDIPSERYHDSSVAANLPLDDIPPAMWSMSRHRIDPLAPRNAAMPPPSYHELMSSTMEMDMTGTRLVGPPKEPVLGGLNSDDMGLGKTLTAIALMVSEPFGPPLPMMELEGAPSQSNPVQLPLYNATRLMCDSMLVGAGDVTLTDSQRKLEANIVKLPRSARLAAAHYPTNPMLRLVGSILSGATLVVCPLSVVENWETQLKTHLKSTHQLSVHVYHEKGRKIDVQQLSQFDVVLTTYQVIANEYKASDFEPEKKKNGSEDVSRLPSFELSSLFTIHWHRVILDEAHTIRESKTLTARAACALSAGRRWALTGTPIVNRIDDLGTLVKFIGVPQLSDTRQWQSIIGKPFTSNMKLVQQSAMNRLRKLMQTLCMRRTKMGKDRNGQLLLKLPEKIERVQWLDLEVRERALYSAVELKAREKLVELLNEGNLMDNYMYILVFILRLRQVCTHVDLYNPGASVQLRLGQEEEEGDNNDQDNQSAQAANSLRNKLLKGEPGDSKIDLSKAIGNILSAVDSVKVDNEDLADMDEDIANKYIKNDPSNNGTSTVNSSRQITPEIKPGQAYEHATSAPPGAGVASYQQVADQRPTMAKWNIENNDVTIANNTLQASALTRLRIMLQAHSLIESTCAHPQVIQQAAQLENRFRSTISQQQQPGIAASMAISVHRSFVDPDMLDYSKLTCSLCLVSILGDESKPKLPTSDIKPGHFSFPERRNAHVTGQIGVCPGNQFMCSDCLEHRMDASLCPSCGTPTYDEPDHIVMVNIANGIMDPDKLPIGAPNLVDMEMDMQSIQPMAGSDSTARNAAINANVEAVLEEQRRRSRRERKARRSARSTRPGGGRSISTVSSSEDSDSDQDGIPSDAGMRSNGDMEFIPVDFDSASRFPPTKVRMLMKCLEEQAGFEVSLLNGRIAESKRVTRPDGTPRDKCVIFSQWTKMLDLIEVHLQSRGIAWRRLDGSMNRDERTEALQIFQDRQSAVDIMLISLRAGGVGLNLTSARRVYMMEPYWNPAVEDQAVDRVHRLGQTSDVEIVRFLIRDSIEERMVMLQFAKAKLHTDTFNEEARRKYTLGDEQDIDPDKVAYTGLLATRADEVAKAQQNAAAAARNGGRRGVGTGAAAMRARAAELAYLFDVTRGEDGQYQILSHERQVEQHREQQQRQEQEQLLRQQQQAAAIAQANIARQYQTLYQQMLQSGQQGVMQQLQPQVHSTIQPTLSLPQYMGGQPHQHYQSMLGGVASSALSSIGAPLGTTHQMAARALGSPMGSAASPMRTTAFGGAMGSPVSNGISLGSTVSNTSTGSVSGGNGSGALTSDAQVTADTASRRRGRPRTRAQPHAAGFQPIAPQISAGGFDPLVHQRLQAMLAGGNSAGQMQNHSGQPH